MEQQEAFICRRGFRRGFEILFPNMATANRHRSGMRFFSTMIKNDLEKGNNDFTTHCDYPVKVDSASIINILGLLKHAIFIDANKTWDDSYVCGKWNGYICHKSTLFNFFFTETKFCCWSSES